MTEDKDKGYTVRDRRVFFQETPGEEKRTEEKPAPEAKAQPKEGPAEPEAQEKAKRPTVLPPVDFSTFIFSLNTSALVYLGEIPDPVTGTNQTDLSIAKHTIDTIALLQEKTKGNLTKDEEALLEHILYDLRMRYVSKA